MSIGTGQTVPMQVVAIVFSWSISILPLAAEGASLTKEETPDNFVVSFTSRDQIVERPSGELQIHLPQARKFEDGTLYRISLAFKDRDDYMVIKNRDGYEDVPENNKVKYDLSLNDLDWLVFFGEEDLVILEKAKMTASLDLVFSTATRPLCSDVIARGGVEFLPDVFVGINIHTPFGIAQGAPLDKSAPPPPCPEEDQCNFDALDDCDFWAAGGCGGPDCYNFCEINCKVYVQYAHCTVLEIPIFPDICICD